MKINHFRAAATVTFLLAAALFTAVSAANPPNIVVILTDDQGYADISLNPHHPQEVSTPNMDALAEKGVVFSQGYTSGHVCSPTRAGLILGRYQQRVGVYSAGDGGRGFDPALPIFPAFLPEQYVSTAIGKWHLGLDEDFPELKWHAMNRGFDECYKFMGRGGHSYFDLRSDTDGKFSHPIGVQPPENPPFDGKSLLPLLTGKSKTHHETLYWSKGSDGEWAVRRGDWKLRSVKGQFELFNLAEDPSETTNLANKRPELVQTLTDAFDAWIEPMADPITGGNRRWNASVVNKEGTQRERQREERKRLRGNRRETQPPAARR